jgi:probable F420-dependent oxidoreductase
MTDSRPRRFGIEAADWLSPTARVLLAQEAEHRGADDIFMAEVGDPDAFVTGGLILNGTSRVRFGTCIAQIGPRSVPMLAAGAATLAWSFPGRFALGLGVSSRVIVERWHGVEWKSPLTRAAEAVELARSLLRGETSQGTGHEIHSKGFRLSHPPSPPPEIQLAGLNEQMLRLAARVADGVWLNFLPWQRAEAVVKLITEEAAAAGRPAPEILLSLPCYITADPADAQARIRDMLSFYVTSPDYRKALTWHGFGEEMAAAQTAFRARDKPALRAAITPELVDSISLIGSAGAVAERLDRYRNAGIGTLSVGVEDDTFMRAALDHMSQLAGRHG